jgi:hypothetical protein
MLLGRGAHMSRCRLTRGSRVVHIAVDRLRQAAGRRMSQAAEFLEARPAVANAKLLEFRKQCWRLAHLARQGTVSKADAVDLLWEIAIGHALGRALGRALGEERVQLIISEPFTAIATEAAA